MEVLIKRLTNEKGEKPAMPFYATKASAGMDLSAHISAPLLLKKGEIASVPTGISIALPNENYVAYIYGRSGLGIRHGITLANCVGVIDADYRGEIRVGLINLGAEDYTIEPGERIAQMVFAPIIRGDLKETDALPETERNSGGFGSTGR